jgi:hypothetical protein
MVALGNPLGPSIPAELQISRKNAAHGLAGAAPPRQRLLAKEALKKANKAKQPERAQRGRCLCHDEGRTRRSGLIDCCPMTTHA